MAKSIYEILADLTTTTSVPGFGDEIQAIKAGIMEIGDIFVVNKADRENADRAVVDIKSMLELSSLHEKWRPAIVKTIALTGEGVIELLQKIREHRKYLETSEGVLRLRALVEREVIEAIKQKMTEHLIEHLRTSGTLNLLVSRILAKEIDPTRAAESVVQEQESVFKRRFESDT